MKKIHPLITGTIILTMTGFTSRIIGFFYRIFLSQTFGAEGMGIYQLISPAMALAFSFTAAGIQTAISKYVANETTTHDYKSSCKILLVGITISLVLSAIFSIFLYEYSLPIATYALLEVRCAPLLRVIALSIPFGAVHSCINGYFYGIKQTKIPAITQLAEQIARVASVYILYEIMLSRNSTPSLTFAVIGLIIGEIVSMLISVVAIYFRFYSLRSYFFQMHWDGCKDAFQKIMYLAIPLSANRIVINFLQSIEAIYIPNRLQAFGLTVSDALSIYGVLTGMALPLILFPSAITNSVSVLLLPIVSEAESNHNFRAINRAIIKSLRYCFLLGFLCTAVFFFGGNYLGEFLFHSKTAGSFITTLSFICPFLYLSSMFSSILHGLGKAFYTFAISVFSLIIRLLFVFFLIPFCGIKAYLWGLLCSQLIMTLFDFLALRTYISFSLFSKNR